jgi:hypothetical protein
MRDHCCRPISRSAITIRPDQYNGDDDWEQYISHFEDCAELGQWNQKEMLLTLAASLKGQARVFYTSLSQTDRSSYRGLVNVLEQRFGSARQQARWLSRFQARTKLFGESIAAFGDDLRLLARKAYGNLELEAQETLALQQFYKALSVEMKCRVMDKECSTVTEAVDVVERYSELLGDNVEERRGREKVRYAAEGSREGRKGNPLDQSMETSQELNIGDIHEALKSIQIRLDRLEKGQSKSQSGPRQCYGCQSKDHLLRDCPKKKDQKSDGFKSGNERKSSL